MGCGRPIRFIDDVVTRAVPPGQNRQVLARRCDTESGKDCVCSGKRSREGMTVGERADHCHARSRRYISDAFWARADNGCETDSFFSAYAEDALAEAAGSADDSHVTREWARLGFRWHCYE